MILIKCVNLECTASNRVFSWNERSHLEVEGKIAQEGENGAISFLVDCPYCGTENKIWLFKVKQVDSVTRGK